MVTKELISKKTGNGNDLIPDNSLSISQRGKEITLDSRHVITFNCGDRTLVCTIEAIFKAVQSQTSEAGFTWKTPL
jgi:hypothetical protein